MMGLIAWLTIRQLLGQRRVSLLLLLSAMPLVVAMIFRLGERPDRALEFTVSALLAGLVTTGVLPVAAVVIGTSALGNEFEDGTALLLLAKPVSRAQIIAGKWLAAAFITILLVVPSSVAAALISLDRTDVGAVVPGFAVALLLGSAAYSAVLVALSVFTSRALIIGLGYAFLWEGAVTQLFRGIRVLSIRQFTLGLAGWLTDVSVPEFNPTLGGGAALAGLLAACSLGFALATWRLSRWQVRESS